MRHKIKYVFVDCDGSLTDGTIFYDRNGPVGRNYSAVDGKGFELLMNAYITPIIITQSSGLSSLDIVRRGERFGVDVYTAIKNKKAHIQYLIENQHYKDMEWYNIAYFGDDINDLNAMATSHIAGCPLTASRLVLDHVIQRKKIDSYSGFISDRQAGKGAFRDFADHILIYCQRH